MASPSSPEDSAAAISPAVAGTRPLPVSARAGGGRPKTAPERPPVRLGAQAPAATGAVAGSDPAPPVSALAGGAGPRARNDEERAAQRAAWKKAVSAKNADQRRSRHRRKPPGITGVRAAKPKGER